MGGEGKGIGFGRSLFLLTFVLSVQETINDSYIADMAKYATSAESIRIMAAYQSIPARLAKENKNFQYRLIKSGARTHEYELVNPLAHRLRRGHEGLVLL
ncbi:hypothetical protein CEB3_c04800 [Peptococcaceae bacterium CEB3]|nr:hypothetical protein CEB3_c04800 [Peptococcaceae bacterium CEB3]